MILDWFRLDGIHDNEIPAASDWQYLTPLERIGVQSYDDYVIAINLIEERKQQ